MNTETSDQKARAVQDRHQSNPPPSGSQTAAASNPGSSPIDTATLEARLAAERDKYLRLAADFENYRKRSCREAERHGLALKDAFIRDLLPVIDNLERAQVAISSGSDAPLHQGLKLTLQQLFHLLQRHGLEPEEALGRPFDPYHHDAACVRVEPALPHHTVVEVWQRGWRRGSECFRPSKVVVNDLSSMPQGGVGEVGRVG